MDKRSTKAPKKLFDFNLESLLEDDFTQDDEINSQILNKEVCSQPKRIKVKESTVRLRSQSKKQFNNNFELNKNAVDEEFEDVNDISKFFENVSNDFNKSMSVKKARLREFTEAVIKLFQTKITKMINEQEEEIQHFKTETVNKIEIEMKTYEEEIKKLQIQENKLLKILQEQVKLLRKTSDSQKRWIENFTDLHKNFVEVGTLSIFLFFFIHNIFNIYFKMIVLSFAAI